MKTTLIDNGFMLISEADAKKLGGGTLPAYGRERLVKHDGKDHWLARTRYMGKIRWSIREKLKLPRT